MGHGAWGLGSMGAWMEPGGHQGTMAWAGMGDGRPRFASPRHAGVGLVCPFPPIFMGKGSLEASSAGPSSTRQPLPNYPSVSFFLPHHQFRQPERDGFVGAGQPRSHDDIAGHVASGRLPHTRPPLPSVSAAGFSLLVPLLIPVAAP